MGNTLPALLSSLLRLLHREFGRKLSFGAMPEPEEVAAAT